jgi:hypothetical protein
MASPTQFQAPPSKPSWFRRWTYRLLALCCSLAFLEGVSALAWWLGIPGADLDIVRGNRDQIAFSGRLERSLSEAIHPYLGWVLNPNLHDAETIGSRSIDVNRFGFVDDGDTLYQRGPDRLVVVVVVGSVAQQFSFMGEAELRKRLEDSPAYKGRKIQFVRMALSGHKQPQQLMALSYLLAMGGELDLLINIDGYNETALSLTENADLGVAMAYPRMWHYRLQDVVDPRVDAESFQLLRLRMARKRAAEFMQSKYVTWSPTCNLAWLVYDRWADRSLTAIGNDIRNHENGFGRGFAKDGPMDNLQSDDDRSRAVCQIWQTGSRQLHRLCQANGIRYFHVLQPNQYLADSKTLSSFEQEKCYLPEQRYAIAIRTVYPELRKSGEQLTKEGIAYLDATQLFAKETETTYADYFGHYNQKGNDLLADAVSTLIVAGDPPN